MHVPVGKASFEHQQLHDNIAALVSEIVKAKPSGAKGSSIRGLHLTSTMGPSVKLELQSTISTTAE